MASIAIKKLDNVNIKVSGEPSILQELNEHFSFEAPGAKFHPLYRAKKWDGRIRIFHLLSGTLPAGLLSYLEHFCEVNGYSIDYEEYYQEVDTATIDQVRKFCQSLDLSLPQGQSIREYQVEAVYQAITSGRKLLLSPTGSGKSLILYCLIRWHEQFDRQQLIIVPTTSLCLQMKSDFKSYSLNNGWDGDRVRVIMGGEEKDNTSAVTVSTWQSLYDLPKKFFADFDVVYGDECLHPDSLITMSDGTTKKICDVEVGDFVKTFNESTKCFESNLVLKKHLNISVSEQMYELSLGNGSAVKITGNHKVLLTNGNWKRVDDLQIGDTLNSIE